MILQDQKIRLHLTDLAGSNREIEGEVGSSLMQIIRDAGIDDIPAFCGGCCSCASCHVHIDDAFISMLPPMSDDESELLDGSSHRTTRSRLSCQVKASSELSGLRLTIAPQE